MFVWKEPKKEEWKKKKMLNGIGGVTLSLNLRHSLSPPPPMPPTRSPSMPFNLFLQEMCNPTSHLQIIRIDQHSTFFSLLVYYLKRLIIIIIFLIWLSNSKNLFK